ncbi:Gfo/Idh/MocA family protein [Spirillospora sp. CA-294931]|uniref:Gfo/Idh/MocA family protein n=1 Tax=Spirillospora sp. CA-294931 TaxID=3240042 RepID=UPI003D8DF041
MTNEAPIRLGIIGLGAMGSELLDVADAHPDFTVVLGADPSAGAVERARTRHPGVTFTRDPDELLRHEGLDAVYIGSPPVTHAAYALHAMKAGLAVFCEKPLAVSLSEGERMVAAAAAEGAVNALNFTLSDRRAALEVGRALREDEAGTVLGVEMRFLFPEWPREFQREARWVAGREQGGFLREVASHFLYLTDRLLGPLVPEHKDVVYGTEDEVEATALYRAGEVPVRLLGQVAAAPETYEWTLYGSKRSYRITGFARLEVADASGWTPVELDGPRGTEHTRLTAFAHAVRGGEATLPDFAAGLRVQRLVEHLHA